MENTKKPIKIGRTEYNPVKFRGYSKQQFLNEFKSLPAEYADYLDAAWEQVQSALSGKTETPAETKSDAESNKQPKKGGGTDNA